MIPAQGRECSDLTSLTFINSAILGLRSLQMRKLHQYHINTYKIIFRLVDLDCPKFFLISSNEKTRGHLNELFVCYSGVDV